MGLVLALAVAGAGTGVWFATRPSATTPQAMRQVITVSPTTLKTTVSATGTLEPERTSTLTFGSSGTVTAVNVAVGDEVTEGQVLATMDTASLDIALSSAQADLTAAKENLADLEDADDSTDAAINAASASVEVKTNAVATAKANLEAGTMTAPFSGIVADVGIAEGDSTGSSSGGSSQTATGGGSSTSTSGITVITKDSFTVSASVSSSDIASVKRGLQAELTIGGAEETVYGTVASVAVVATTSSSGTASFPVTIKVTGKPTGLFAGSSVTANIIVSQQADVIAVSAAAITTGTDDTSTVTKVVDGVDTEATITTGETVNGQVIVTEGLSEGDQIVIEVTAPTAQGNQGTQQTGTGQFPGGGGQMPNFGTDGSMPQPPEGGQMGGGQMGGPNR